MIISKMIADGFIYYDLHSEEVISSNFIEDSNSGIYCDRLQSITVKRVQADIMATAVKEDNIAFDFKNIEAVQPNLNAYFTELKKGGHQIVFLNIPTDIIEELGYNSITNIHNKEAAIPCYDKVTLEARIRDGFSKYYLFENPNDFCPTDFNSEHLFKEHFKSVILKYIKEHEQPHTSSFVYLTSYIDIKKFISWEKPLCIYSIYRLALKILKKWRKSAPIPTYFPDKKSEVEAPILVCQSMNSSYIVSILSNLLKLDVLILDKIGPINNLYNSINKNIIQERNYIVVSDLVCLGTEVKIVKNIIQFFGGKYVGNVALIKTETLKRSDISKTHATVAVFSIDRTNNRELKYHITTDLESPHE